PRGEKARPGRRHEITGPPGPAPPPADVEKAFALKEPLPTPTGVGANQPFPWPGVYKLAGLFLGLLVAVGLMFACLLPTRTVYEQTYQLQPGTATAGKTQTFFT